MSLVPFLGLFDIDYFKGRLCEVQDIFFRASKTRRIRHHPSIFAKLMEESRGLLCTKVTRLFKGFHLPVY